MAGEFDARDFRTAAGQFLTGVTIVTTLDAEGKPCGLTANSFTSVSLHPPLVLWCIGRDSTNLDAFDAGNPWAVHVLGLHQQDLAVRFSTKGIERFDGIDWSPGVDGTPLLPGALAVFECRPSSVYDGGDHLIYLGEVAGLTIGDTDRPALGYFRSRYIGFGG